MKIKKTAAKKVVGTRNRLNGDGNECRATYGVFNAEGVQVGFVTYGRIYDAWTFDGERLNSFSTASLADLKKQLAKK